MGPKHIWGRSRSIPLNLFARGRCIVSRKSYLERAKFQTYHVTVALEDRLRHVKVDGSDGQAHADQCTISRFLGQLGRAR